MGHNNDSPKCGIHNRTVGSSTSRRSKVSSAGKNNPPLYIVVDDTDKGGKSSDNLENVYDEIQNVKTTD